MTIYRDQLEAVYRLIEKPENWTQGAYARDADGHDIDELYSDREECVNGFVITQDHRAVCWCLNGAAMKYGIDESDIKDACSVDMPFSHIWNDTHTHAEVLELLRNAIERAPVRP